MKPFRVVIDPGHGGHDSGATFGGLKESDVVIRICRYLQCKIFQETEWEMLLTRYVDNYVYLSDRVKMAKDYLADIFISIHCNADPDEDLPGMKEARGEEIWYYPESKISKKLAEICIPYFISWWPNEPFRGVKPGNFYVLRQTHKYNIPALLFEMGFIDNSDTNLKFNNPQVLEEIAVVIFECLKSIHNELSGNDI